MNLEGFWDDNYLRIVETNIQYVHGLKDKDVLPIYYRQTNLITALGNKKVYLGNRETKFCRFCRRNESQTTFEQEAHLLPEFMGNRILFSYFECDECNSMFSKYETAFTNYFGVHHTFSRLKGKNKIPQYHNKKENFNVIPEAEEIDVRSGKGNQSVFIDQSTQKITIKTIRPSYVPRDVLKCLVKIGMCAVNENDLIHFEQTRKWLRSEIDESLYPKHPLFIVYYNIGGGLKARAPFVALQSRIADMPVPQSVILIGYDRFKFQLFMPHDTRDQSIWSEPKVLLPIHDKLIREREDGKGLGFYWKDFSGIAKVVDDEHVFSMRIEDD